MFESIISENMTDSEIDNLLAALTDQILLKLGDQVNISHDVDFTKNLIKTIIIMTIELGEDFNEFVDSTIFPFLTTIEVTGLEIVSDIDVVVNGEVVD